METGRPQSPVPRHNLPMSDAAAVVAGVIARDGRVLICRRAAGKRHALKWEFPGGKVEPGEDPPQALARELGEELGIRAVIGGEITRYPYRYPDRHPILLIFFHVTAFEGEPVNREFSDMVWELPERLPEYDFLDGDVDFVRTLARRPPPGHPTAGR
jgi:8-oxo-dGTP diphosphatase